MATDEWSLAVESRGVTAQEVRDAEASLEASPRHASEAAARRRHDRGDLYAIGVLVAIPAAIFIGASVIAGNLLLSGDNLLQNYPLRVLVGEDLRHGIPPWWDPFVWSGTPLLAGMNAGALYPATLLFVVFPAHAAWAFGQVLVYSSVAVGTFCLFRSCGISVRAALLGAFSFAFAGAVVAQTAVHVDMGDGLASLPWAVLAVRKIGDDGRWRWVALLSASMVLSILAGSPEAVLDTGALCMAVCALRLSSRNGSWRVYTSRIAVGALVTLGITAFVWIPAFRFIDSSQRPGGGESFASEFAFPPRASFLSVIPYIEGGYRLLSQPAYFGQSNPEEVAFYVGILPVIAVLTFLVRPWRRTLPTGELRCWYGVIVVGLVLAIGAATPFEHLLYEIPFYGKQRDSGRNIVDVDLAACALFAWWIETKLRTGTIREGFGSIWRRAVPALIPLAVIGGIGVILWAGPGELWHLLFAQPPPGGAVGSGAAVAMAAVLAAGGATLALLRPRMRPRTWVRWVSAFVVVDVGLFVLGTGYASAQPPPDRSPSAVLALVKANLSPSGRYAVYDPDLYDGNALVDAGEPDDGILAGMSSFSGYGSIVDSQYANATLSQNRDSLNVSALASGAFDPLGLQVLVTVPESFLVPVEGLPDKSGSVEALAEQPGSDPAIPAGNDPPPVPPLPPPQTAPARSAVRSGSVAGWWFGTTLQVREVVLDVGEPTDGQVVRIGTLGDDGKISWSRSRLLPIGANTASFGLGATRTAGLAVESLSGPPLRKVRVAVQTVAGRAYEVSGALADAVVPGTWANLGEVDDFSLYRARFTPSAAWLQPAGSQSLSSQPIAPELSGTSGLGTARVTASSTDSTTVEVHANRPALVVWSTAWDSGWRATMMRGSYSARVDVVHVGLVQGVQVPSGSSTITFNYEPSGFSSGVIISSLTAGGLAILAAVLIWRRRRPHDPSLVVRR